MKQRIRAAQLRASVSVNRELVLLYWSIGQEILIRQAKENWGSKVMDRLAADLKRAFPEMKGFSPRNLKYMRAFAEAGQKSNSCKVQDGFATGHSAADRCRIQQVAFNWHATEFLYRRHIAADRASPRT